MSGPTFVQPAITGYRQLTETDVAFMNEIKEHGENLRNLITRIQHYIETNQTETHSQVTHPSRWAAMGMTDLQSGLMKLTRAVAQPTSF